jgi:hypothetical protein
MQGLFFGAVGGARTLTSLLISDFESDVSTIPPQRLFELLFGAVKRT